MLVKTAAQALARVVSLADIDGQTSGTNPRHAEADNLLMLNDSYRMVREHYTVNGFREYITVGAEGTGPSTAETNETYGVVDYPTTVMSLVGFDVLLEGRWRPLEEIDWEERRSFQHDGSREPKFYSLRSFGSVSGATASAGKIAFFPFVPSITYRLHTLDEWTDITDTTHAFILPSQSGYDLMVYDTAWKIAALRDGDRNARAQWLMRGIETAKAAIGTFTPKVTQTGPKTIRRDRYYRSSRGW